MLWFTDPLLWILIFVVLVAVGAVLQARRTNMALRGQLSTLRGECEELVGEREPLTAVNGRIRAEREAERTERDLELERVRADGRDETTTVLKSAVLKLQSLAEEQKLIIDQLQQKYGEDEEVLADLMRIDHATNQVDLRAQGIVVLCGGWLGRRETSASVYDIARSAQGRIKQFQRVEIHPQVNPTVASQAVEPAALVLAELLANAADYSAPSTPVKVSIQAVPKGVCLIVDDYGLGMNQEERDRAAALLSRDGAVDLMSLGNPPKFGFAVAGMLASRYGFQLSVSSVSPYGGVSAVILLPENLLVHEVPEPGRDAGTDADTTAAVDAPRPAAVPMARPEPVESLGTTIGGLPKRRRRLSAVESSPAQPEPGPVPEQDIEVTASRISAFARGTRRGLEKTTTEGSQDR